MYNVFDKNKRYGVGAFILNPNNRTVLLAKRSNTESYNGYWCIFGGGVDRGENFFDALYRELFEEAKIKKEHFDLCEIPVYVYDLSDDFSFITFVGISKDEFDVELNNEHEEYGWFDIFSIPSPIHPGLLSFLTDSDVIDILSNIV